MNKYKKTFVNTFNTLLDHMSNNLCKIYTYDITIDQNTIKDQNDCIENVFIAYNISDITFPPKFWNRLAASPRIHALFRPYFRLAHRCLVWAFWGQNDIF